MAYANNPQYPHHCTIYKVQGDQFSEPVKTAVYDGKCRKERNTSIRNFYSNDVSTTDYRVSIPGFHGDILPGDMMDIEDRSTAWKGLLILDAHVSNFGTEAFFSIPKN